MPTREEPQYRDKDGRPQPIVKLLGVSMQEKRRDLLMLILIPAMVGLIDTLIYSTIIIKRLPDDATFYFFIPIFIAIPIGLTASEAGRALIGGIFGALFFLLFLIIFLSSPGLIMPDLGIGNFIFTALAFSIVYFIMMTLATLFGAAIGMILREFL
ncbi:MAG: hypothetical protein ACXABX_08345 [Candidatus Thorarchaeota archaeon]